MIGEFMHGDDRSAMRGQDSASRISSVPALDHPEHAMPKSHSSCTTTCTNSSSRAATDGERSRLQSKEAGSIPQRITRRQGAAERADRQEIAQTKLMHGHLERQGSRDGVSLQADEGAGRLPGLHGIHEQQSVNPVEPAAADPNLACRHRGLRRRAATRSAQPIVRPRARPTPHLAEGCCRDRERGILSDMNGIPKDVLRQTCYVKVNSFGRHPIRSTHHATRYGTT